MSGYSVGVSDLIANKTTNDAISDIIIKKKNEVKSLIDQTHLGIFENTWPLVHYHHRHQHDCYRLIC